MAKSLKVAFLLWGTLGLFGAHHFYLRRDRHGFIHLVTFGGCIIGWLYDAFRMQRYVEWANTQGSECEPKNAESTESQDAPLVGVHVNLASTILAQSLGSLARNAVPVGLVPDSLEPVIIPLWMAFATAYTVYFLGNIGKSEGSFRSALKGALWTLPYYMYYPNGSGIWCLMVSEHAFGTSQKCRTRPEDHGSLLRRFVQNASLLVIVIALATSSSVYNCSVAMGEGEPDIQCIEFVQQLKDYVRQHGVRRLWEEIYKIQYAESDAAALLGLQVGASESEIRAAYRKLALQYHPDKVKDPEERLSAQRKFTDIAAAYELLLTTAKRVKADMKTPDGVDNENVLNLKVRTHTKLAE